MNEVEQLYVRRASRYDITSRLYYLIGVPMMGYRRRAMRHLNLGRGERVLDLACGTGLNFTLLQEAVGREGQIIGLDLTAAMLDKARQRIARSGWRNVELRQADAACFQVREPVDAVLCTFGLSVMPDPQAVMEQVERALKPGGRFAVADVKLTEGRWSVLNPLAAWLVKPFANRGALLQRKPWLALRERFAEFQYSEHYLGFICVASGTRREKAVP